MYVYMYIHIQLNHFALQQKLTQCCKSSIPQKVILKKKWKQKEQGFIFLKNTLSLDDWTPACASP